MKKYEVYYERFIHRSYAKYLLTTKVLALIGIFLGQLLLSTVIYPKIQALKAQIPTEVLDMTQSNQINHLIAVRVVWFTKTRVITIRLKDDTESKRRLI